MSNCRSRSIVAVVDAVDAGDNCEQPVLFDEAQQERARVRGCSYSRQSWDAVLQTDADDDTASRETDSSVRSCFSVRSAVDGFDVESVAPSP